MAREPNLPSGYVTSVYFESSASLFPSHPQINTGAALKTSLRPNPSAPHVRCAKPFVCLFLRMPSKRKESGYPVQLHSLQEQPHPRVQKSFTTRFEIAFLIRTLTCLVARRNDGSDLSCYYVQYRTGQMPTFH